MISTDRVPGTGVTSVLLPLSNSDKKTRVSIEDYDWLKQFTWRLKRSRCGWYVCTTVRVGENKKRFATLRMHRMVANCWNDLSVDHIDRDHLNNTRENLEIVTIGENIRRYWDWWGNERYKDEVPF